MEDRIEAEREREKSMASAHLAERRERRYDIADEIEIRGIDDDGEVFHERTVTENVSEWGCAFATRLPLKVEDMVAIRLVAQNAGQTGKQSLFQIVAATRKEDRWMVRAWRMGGENLWSGIESRIMAKNGPPKVTTKLSEVLTKGKDE